MREGVRERERGREGGREGGREREREREGEVRGDLIESLAPGGPGPGLPVGRNGRVRQPALAHLDYALSGFDTPMPPSRPARPPPSPPAHSAPQRTRVGEGDEVGRSNDGEVRGR